MRSNLGLSFAKLINIPAPNKHFDGNFKCFITYKSSDDYRNLINSYFFRQLPTLIDNGYLTI